VGQLGEGDWRYPFVFRVPWVGQGHADPVSDEQADESVGNMPTGKMLPAPRVE